MGDMEICDRYYAVLGKPNGPDKTGANEACKDGNLTKEELEKYWGIDVAVLSDAARSAAIDPSDGIDEAELEALERVYAKGEEQFVELFKNELGGEKKAKELYQQVWDLAIQGKLSRSEWNRLMEENNLQDFCMTSGAFDVLLGEKDNYKSGFGRVERMVYDLKNMRLNQQDLKAICSHEGTFRIIDMADMDRFMRDVLSLMQEKKPGEEGYVDVMDLTPQELLAEIKRGTFGDKLKQEAEGMSMGPYSVPGKNWEELIIAKYSDMRQKMMAGINEETQEGVYWEVNTRREYLADIVSGEKPDKYNILTRMCADYFKEKTTGISYKALKEGELAEKEEDWSSPPPAQ